MAPPYSFAVVLFFASLEDLDLDTIAVGFPLFETSRTNHLPCIFHPIGFARVEGAIAKDTSRAW
jgi:hypothetical protein